MVPVIIWAFGGDFGDTPNDGNFWHEWRNLFRSYILCQWHTKVKKIHQPVKGLRLWEMGTV